MAFGTFASVTSFAKQTRAVANVGAPWSLSAMPRPFHLSACRPWQATTSSNRLYLKLIQREDK
ncbi:hypothetical protein EHR06_07775 [Leptospira dzoumogneensis]|uniref:Uncharacterized protein n=1 Tax=Leptospira dzoumogneensis TaxID=2484904 RepID=A0A4Z1APN6_9LEPT|nr:hypothetical protein EHR06_07775 [Leptospira dzoumogneensis]